MHSVRYHFNNGQHYLNLKENCTQFNISYYLKELVHENSLNCFSVNITCNGLPMMIKVDYSKLTANEKRDKKISLSS